MNTEDSLEVQGPMGIKATAKGERAAAWLLAIVCTAALSLLGFRHHDSTEANHREVKESLSEMIYVLSLSPEERARLNIAMPDSMRKKVRHGRREREEP